jgi:thiamine kinase-like enzyme
MTFGARAAMDRHSWSAAVPESKRAAVARALQFAFGSAEVDACEILTRGASSALVFRIWVKDKPYILRLVMDVTLLNDPQRQYACMNAAAAAGIAPRVRYASAADAVSIIDYIEARPFPEEPAEVNHLLVELARTVRSIHSLPGFPSIVNFLEAIDMMIVGFKAAAILPGAATDECLRLYSILRKSYPRNDPNKVSSHNDLNINNVLYDGNRVWIVDWEAAFSNDAYADLANVANSFVSNEAQEELYLNEYFGGELDDYKRARFFLMQQVNHVFYAMVLLNLAALGKKPGTKLQPSADIPRLRGAYELVLADRLSLKTCEGQFLMGQMFLNEALLGLTSPRFDSSLKIMASSAHSYPIR